MVSLSKNDRTVLIVAQIQLISLRAIIQQWKLHLETWKLPQWNLFLKMQAPFAVDHIHGKEIRSSHHVYGGLFFLLDQLLWLLRVGGSAKTSANNEKCYSL